jgi:hypothetical protein
MKVRKGEQGLQSLQLRRYVSLPGEYYRIRELPAGWQKLSKIFNHALR